MPEPRPLGYTFGSDPVLRLVLKDFVRSVFNPAFPHYDDFAIAGGADLGTVIGTSNGLKGDHELLFLGASANHAAKIISTSGRMRLTKHIYEALPKDLQALCSCTGDEVYQLAVVKRDELDELLKKYKIGWRREASAKRIEEDKKRFPLKDIAYSSAEEPIDLDSLSIYNNKRVLAASIFGDVSGFTRYIDAATTAKERKAALRAFHAIRKEMAYVVRQDFGGLRIQYQGDRVQGLFHLPENKAAAIATKAVEAAIGLQSSMEHTLKQCLPEASSLTLAVGIDQGITLVSKLGTRGQRDRICLGTAVEWAAACEERSSGGQIGITKEVYTLLPTTHHERFTYSQTAQCYVATNLTADKLERAMRGAQNYSLSKPVYTSAGAGGITVSSQEVSGARPVSPKKPYAP